MLSARGSMADFLPVSERTRSPRHHRAGRRGARPAPRRDPGKLRRAALRPRQCRRTWCATARGSRRRLRSGPTISWLSARPGAPKIRCETVTLAAFRRSQVDVGGRDRQRRHAVPGRFGDGRDCRAPARRAPGRASGVRRPARPAAKLSRTRSTRRRRRRARELHPYSSRADRR